MNHCLPTPSSDRYIIRHKWQVDFCEGNICAAELISYFASWHDIRLNQSEKSRYANKIAQTHGDGGTQDESLLQFHSQEELKIALHNAYSVDSIRTGIRLLESKGVISRHRNPNPRYHFDKTTYYLFNPKVCAEYIDSLKIGNGKQSGQEREQNSSTMEIPLNQAREQENLPAITYDSTDDTTNTTTEDISTVDFQKSNSSRVKSNYSPGFLNFCKIHPYGNEAKVKPYAIWRKKKLESKSAEICSALSKQLLWPNHRRDNYQFFSRMPAYLNNNRWEDTTSQLIEERKTTSEILDQMIKGESDGNDSRTSENLKTIDCQFSRMDEGERTTADNGNVDGIYDDVTGPSPMGASTNGSHPYPDPEVFSEDFRITRGSD